MFVLFFFFQAEDGIRDKLVTGVQTCALPISLKYRISCGSLSCPVRCFSTSCLNSSLGIELALCAQGAQSSSGPSLRATFTNSLALVHPINFSSGFEIRGRCS